VVSADWLVRLPPGRDREPLVVLQIGWGHGAAFLGAWHQQRIAAPVPACLHFIVVDPALPDGLRLRSAARDRAHAALADELAAQWPPPTPDLHRLAFDGGRVQLLLVPGEALEALPRLRAQVDVFRLDAVDLRTDIAAGAQRLCQAMARLAATEAQLFVADTASMPALRPALRSAGFVADNAGMAADDDGAGAAGGLYAVYRPPFVPRRRHPVWARRAPGHALIVGAGLAGCAAACALAEHGWHSTVIEGTDGPAQQASGNLAGLFHGVVHAQDGAHARFSRAAALQATWAVRVAIDGDGAAGSTAGLLRLETSGVDTGTMQAWLRQQRLPPDYVQVLDAAQASRHCKLPLRHPAWLYPGGGWVQPAALAGSFLRRAGAFARLQTSCAVHALVRSGDAWLLLDRQGQPIAEGGIVVLANADDALRLIGASHWPVQRVRGQISLYDNAAAPATRQIRLPAVPLAGNGYLLPHVLGQALFGATSQPGDDEAAPRTADHEHNLARLRAICPEALPQDATLDITRLHARVGWRCVADDRLPLIGPVPAQAGGVQPRVMRAIDLPRQPGLYLFSALASRGITWAALGGQLLAAQISGAPQPLEASLIDAVDPGRFALRQARRAGPSRRAAAATSQALV
jgi:tRNA 5-methylaminomethyl-2-thiouridine biosynthesis bifunctional protein